MMETVIRDLRLAVRSLLRSPAFSLVAVLCLALGIGADSAVFSIVDAVLLRPLPYADPDGVVMVYDQFLAKDIERGVVSGYEFFDVRDRSESFDGVAAVTPRYLNLTGDGEPERLVGAAPPRRCSRCSGSSRRWGAPSCPRRTSTARTTWWC